MAGPSSKWLAAAALVSTLGAGTWMYRAAKDGPSGAVAANSPSEFVENEPAAQALIEEKKLRVPVRVVQAADLGDAFAKDSKKAARDFRPKSGGRALQITGRVTSIRIGKALLNNADSAVRVYVAVAEKKAKIGDLIDATVTELKYNAATKTVVVEAESLRVAPEGSAR